MMVQDIEKYIDYCRLFIGEKCAVTDAEIDEALNQFANMFTHIDKLEVKKRLMSLSSLTKVVLLHRMIFAHSLHLYLL